jgi:hypothetical protein
MDRHRFDADPDPDAKFYFDAGSDPDPIGNQTMPIHMLILTQI